MRFEYFLIYAFCRERGDRGVEEGSIEIENQRSKTVHWSGQIALPVGRPVDRWRRPIGCPVDRRARTCTGLSRSTARSTVEESSRPARSTDLHAFALGWARSTGAVDRGMVRSTGRSTDRRVLTFLLGFGFLFWMGSNPIWVFLNPGNLWL